MRNVGFSAGTLAVVSAAVVLSLPSGAAQAQGETGHEALWYVSASLGQIQYEGDEQLEDGLLTTFRLGYDYSEAWSFEGGLAIAPELDENFRFDVPTQARVSRLEESAGPGVHDTWAFGFSIDALYHFTRWERLDPFLAAGAGIMLYADDVDNGSSDASLRVGGGVMYHFNDRWAARADGRTFIAGEDTEANATIDAGVIWTWGATVPPDYTAIGGPTDSDGDGIPDDEEAEWGTDPFDPDTDDDGLTDGEEILQYKTDPLNPDTDLDALKDGEEVHTYTTDPLRRDTDNGGVADGHEVIEDGTDPLDPSDDLALYELYIQFDYDKDIIKPRYFPQLDVIARVLSRNDASTARIEGHADKTKKSGALYNKRLSKRRAKAVLDYLNESGVAAGRMEAVGYGFDRPKAPNDPILGNPENRRVEVYIRDLPDEERSIAPLPEVKDVPPEAK